MSLAICCAYRTVSTGTIPIDLLMIENIKGMEGKTGKVRKARKEAKRK